MRAAALRGPLRLLAWLPVLGLLAATHPPRHVEVLRSTGGLPAHIVGAFREPSVFQQAADGRYFVFDRRGQTVHRIDADHGAATRVVQIGPEDGRILGASTFDLGPDSRFVVADAPGGRERVQTFDLDGARVGSFRLPGKAAPRLTIGAIVLNGVGSLEFTGRSMLMSQPESGGLITRFSLIGRPYQTFGVLRTTGHEAGPGPAPRAEQRTAVGRSARRSLLRLPGGPADVPEIRPGRDLPLRAAHRGDRSRPHHQQVADDLATRPDDRDRTLPVVPPTVRTAAVDRAGNLWVALSAPVLYVYDPTGEKIRTVRLEPPAPCARPAALPGRHPAARRARLLRVHGRGERATVPPRKSAGAHPKPARALRHRRPLVLLAVCSASGKVVWAGRFSSGSGDPDTRHRRAFACPTSETRFWRVPCSNCKTTSAEQDRRQRPATR